MAGRATAAESGRTARIGMNEVHMVTTLGLHHVLLEKVGPIWAEATMADEHRIWVDQDQAARVYSSDTDPRGYAQAYASIAADGEIVTIGQYLNRHSREVELVARESRAFVRAVQLS
jgi:hypothetical protein